MGRGDPKWMWFPKGNKEVQNSTKGAITKMGREGKCALRKPLMVLLLGLWDSIPILLQKLRLGTLALAVGN